MKGQEIVDQWLAMPMPQYEGSGAVSVVAINKAVFPMLAGLIDKTLLEEQARVVKIVCHQCGDNVPLIMHPNKYIPNSPYFVHCDHKEPCKETKDDRVCTATEVHRDTWRKS